MSAELPAAQRAAIRERTLDAMANLPERIGRYEIRGELGHGGMGIVYDGFDPTLKRAVAVKVIHPERIQGVPDQEALAAYFRTEMQATSELFHPNLVAILDAGVERAAHGPRAFYVMERVEGMSLEQRLRRFGNVTRGEGLRIAAEIARGLAAAHELGLVHRDLKPANIMLADRGEAKVADFGLCRLRNEIASMSGVAPILGSANYIAPEQVQSDGVDARADLFALGAIMLRMFAGREPFAAESIAAHFERVIADEPDGLDVLDADVRPLVKRLLAKDPTGRPSSAQEVADELATLAAVPLQRENDSNLRAGARFRSGRLLAAAGAIIGITALMWGALLMRNELVALDSEAQTQWQQVHNQLARQYELIPSLVKLTERYADHELEVIRTVVNARRRYDQTSSPETAITAERALTRFLVLVEQYPDLKADRHYQSLAYEVAGTKNRIAVERMRYNQAVGLLNQRLQQLPWKLLGGSLSPRPYFEPPAEHLVDPSLDS